MADDILINISEPSPIEIDIALPSPLAFSLDAGVSIHNLLSGLQGGQAGQYYHVTAADYAARILGSGTLGYVPYFTGAQTLENSEIFYNAVNKRVGIGIAAPDSKLSIFEEKNGGVGFSVLNPSTGVAGNVAVYFGEWGSSQKYGGFNYFNNSYTVNGLYLPNSTLMYSASLAGLTIGAINAVGVIRFATGGKANANERMRIIANGNIGIGLTSPTARLHLPAAAAGPGLASLKINAGVLATIPVSGNIESDGTHLYWTDSGGTRRQLDN